MSVREKIEGWWDDVSDDHREYIRRGLWFATGFLVGAVLL